jgi:hypothetical protein
MKVFIVKRKEGKEGRIIVSDNFRIINILIIEDMLFERRPGPDFLINITPVKMSTFRDDFQIGSTKKWAS